MECLHPIMLKDGRLVPCGDCPRCRRNRQRDWTFRLKAERDAADFTLWLTLTIDEKHLTRFEGVKIGDKIYDQGVGVVDKSQPRHFFEALRKHYGHSLTLKHYLVSEYGDGTDRPHYHCLLFGYVNDKKSFYSVLQAKQDILHFICDPGSTAWPFGFCLNKALHNHVFGYITNYVNKPEIISDHPHPVRPFTCISQGIGLDMLNKIDQNRIKNDLNMIINYDGGKKALPRYYREKILPASRTTYLKALAAGELEEAQRILDNKIRMEKFLENYVYPKKEAEASRKMRDFEKDHTISYAEYRQGCRSHELQEYKQKLKKRKSL